MTIDDAFQKFHREHPEVYDKFRELALQVRNSGAARYGSKAIMERLRWHFRIEQRRGDFKLNNNFTSRYARLLEENEPLWFRGFFEKRALKT